MDLVVAMKRNASSEKLGSENDDLLLMPLNGGRVEQSWCWTSDGVEAPAKRAVRTDIHAFFFGTAAHRAE